MVSKCNQKEEKNPKKVEWREIKLLGCMELQK